MGAVPRLPPGLVTVGRHRSERVGCGGHQSSLPPVVGLGTVTAVIPLEDAQTVVLEACPPLRPVVGAASARPSGWSSPPTSWPPRTCRRSPTRPSTATPCAPPTSPPPRSSCAWSASVAAGAEPYDQPVAARRGDPDHDRRADAGRRRRRGDGRGHRAARRRRPGAHGRAVGARRGRRAGPATTCARATPCSPPAPSSRPAVAGVLASINAATVPVVPGRSGRPCCRPATSWSTDGVAAAARADPREQPHDARSRCVAEAGCVVDRPRRGAATTRPCSRPRCATPRPTCDAVVTSGGVSMGDYDVVKAVLGRIADMRWMQIAIKPAKPFAFGLLGAATARRCSGCPGNPVSSLVSFELLARPALRRMMGHRHVARPQRRRRRRRRPAPPARRQDALRAGQRDVRRRRPRATCAGRAPRAATSWRPPPLADALAVCPTATASPPVADVAVLLLG